MAPVSDRALGFSPRATVPRQPFCRRAGASLADALRRLIAAGIPLEGASDHGVSEALYLRDPDANGVELYCDRPPEQWPRTPGGALTIFTHPLNLEDLLRDAPPSQ